MTLHELKFLELAHPKFRTPMQGTYILYTHGGKYLDGDMMWLVRRCTGNRPRRARARPTGFNKAGLT